MEPLKERQHAKPLVDAGVTVDPLQLQPYQKDAATTILSLPISRLPNPAAICKSPGWHVM